MKKALLVQILLEEIFVYFFLLFFQHLAKDEFIQQVELCNSVGDKNAKRTCTRQRNWGKDYWEPTSVKKMLERQGIEKGVP